MSGTQPTSPRLSNSSHTETFPRKPLSCTNCRERKVKCDRVSTPCVPCRKNGLKCVFPARRARAPKNRDTHVQGAEGTQPGNAHILDGDGGDDDEIIQNGGSTSRVVPYAHRKFSSLIFAQPGGDTHSKISHPSIAHMKIMYDVYFANFDPVCKILHRPTTNQRLLLLETQLNPSKCRFHASGLDAVAFAIYFAAIHTLSHPSCMTLFGEERRLLLERFKNDLEDLLVQADFLNSSDIVTLQALTIYITVQRSLTQARDIWALIGLAVRLGQGCGLHEANTDSKYGPFEVEMRRRLWWQIMVLETRAADERASESLLTPASFEIPLPCNLNDDDFSAESQQPLQGRTGPTDMTMCLLGIDAACTAQKVRPRPVTHGDGSTSFQEGEEAVRDYARRFESVYLTHCDFSKPRTKVLSTVGYYWTYKLWLLLYYPLSQQISKHSRTPRQGLQLATIFLRHNSILDHHSTSEDLAWFFRSYVPWHAVAVALTEMCREPRGIHADRAWNLVDPCFDEWSERIGDSKSTTVWSHVKLLREKVRSMRRGLQDADHQKGPSSTSIAATEMPNFLSPEMGRDGSNNTAFEWHPMGGNFDISDEAWHLTLNSLPSEPVVANGESTPHFQGKDDAWESFISSVHS